MPTKTFSGRIEEADLLFADALTQEQFGLSYGQYCSTILIELIRQEETLPRPSDTLSNTKKLSAAARLKQLSELPGDPAIAALSDTEIKNLIAGRYEQ